MVDRDSQYPRFDILTHKAPASCYRTRSIPMASESGTLIPKPGDVIDDGSVLVCSASDTDFVNMDRSAELLGLPEDVIKWSYLPLDNLDPALLDSQLSYLGELDDPEMLRSKLEGSPFRVVLFEHPELHEPASISLFCSRLESLPGFEGSASTFDEANTVIAGLIESGVLQEDRPVEYFRGPDLSPEFAENVWELFNQRFQGIADQNLPINLEENHESTLQLLALPSTKIFATVEDGMPLCVLILVEDIDECEWINGANLRLIAGTDKVFFYPGLASWEQGKKHAAQVISRAFLTMAALESSRISFFYECSDVSRLVIPRIIKSNVEGLKVNDEPIFDHSSQEVSTFYYGAIVPL